MKSILVLIIFFSLGAQAEDLLSCKNSSRLNIQVISYEDNGQDLYFLKSRGNQTQFETVFFGGSENQKVSFENTDDFLHLKYVDESEYFILEKELIINKTTGLGEYNHSKTNKYFERTDYLRRVYLSDCAER